VARPFRKLAWSCFDASNFEIVGAKRYAVDLEQLPVINLVRNFPSLNPFPWELVGFATILYCVSTLGGSSRVSGDDDQTLFRHCIRITSKRRSTGTRFSDFRIIRSFITVPTTAKSTPRTAGLRAGLDECLIEEYHQSVAQLPFEKETQRRLSSSY
jgi:hypothetical protein